MLPSVMRFFWRVRKRIEKILDTYSPGWGLRKRFPALSKFLNAIGNQPHFSGFKTMGQKIRAGGFSFYLPAKDTVMTSHIIFKENWEPNLTRLMELCLRPGDVVLDIGANFGYHTVFAASMVGPSGQVLAFEPDPEIFELLNKNLATNKMTNVSAFPLAASDRYEEKKLYRSSFNRGDSRLSAFPDSNEATLIKCVPIQDYLEKNMPQVIDKITLLKIDIQGYEYYALSGMKGLLKEKSIRLFLEFDFNMLKGSGTDWKALWDLLAQSGYAMFDMNDRLKKLSFEQMGNYEKTLGEKYLDLFCAKSNA